MGVLRSRKSEANSTITDSARLATPSSEAITYVISFLWKQNQLIKDKGRNCSNEAMGLSTKISSSSNSYLFVSGRQVSATLFMTHIYALKIISKTQLHPLKLITFSVYSISKHKFRFRADYAIIKSIINI
uniref:Uncharacterized protein n=1 Tax=Glossina palpalis gambiensis TaxID=67801 RepID=A0A1B0B341_9MUSC